MTAALALPAAKMALAAASSLGSGLSGALGSSTASKAIKGIAGALDPSQAKAKKTADDFETMFLEQMTEHMVNSTDTEGPMGENGAGGGIWRSMLNQQYAKQIQASGGLGLSSQIMNSILQVQEKANADIPASTGVANVRGQA
jgi:peptidoglycan hydrolase FlgJ